MSSVLKYVFLWATALILACPAGAATGDQTMHILAFGDSLTAGYGLQAAQSFASQLEKRLLDMGRAVRVTNAGVSGDTTGGGLARLGWSLEDRPDLVILELGANDGLRGLDPERMRGNLEAMINEIRKTDARIILAGMRSPVNWGPAYQAIFDKAFPELAEKYALPLYPFFLEGVVRQQGLVLDDGLHPNGRGVARIVDGILPLVTKELDAIGGAAQ